MNKPNVRYRPSADYPFWFYDPEGDGMTYHKTEEDRDAYAEEGIQGYLDEGWSKEVEQCAAGVLTHFAQCLDRTDRPAAEDLDADGCDGEGTHWPDEFSWRGNYKLEPVTAGIGESK